MRHWWLAACLPLLFAACSRRPAPAAGGDAARPAPSAPSRTQPDRPAQPAPPGQRARPALPPPSPEQVLLALPAARLLPEDFDIGPLGDRLGGSRAERTARAVAVRFLAGLAEGKVPDAELLPERREELSRSLQHYLDRGLLPSRYRLGPWSELEDGSLRCRLRLFGDPGAGSGELYLAVAEGRWYVTDLQAGLAVLGVAAPRRTEKFVPTEAR